MLRGRWDKKGQGFELHSGFSLLSRFQKRQMRVPTTMKNKKQDVPQEDGAAIFYLLVYFTFCPFIYSVTIFIHVCFVYCLSPFVIFISQNMEIYDLYPIHLCTCMQIIGQALFKALFRTYIGT